MQKSPLFIFFLIICLSDKIFALTAEQVIENTEKSAGLCVYLGVNNPTLPIALAKSKTMLIHALSTSQETVKNLQKEMIGQGTYGLSSVEMPVTWEYLPYLDNFANIVIIENLDQLIQKGFSLDEAFRVCAPFGSVVVKKSEHLNKQTSLNRNFKVTTFLGDDGNYMVYKKMLDPGMDEWVDRYRGPEGDGYSRDLKVGPPTHLKWSTASEMPNSQSMNPGVRLGNGRAVLIHQPTNAPMLVSTRDAFSGLPLWKSDTLGANNECWAPFFLDGDYIYTIRKKTGPIVQVDAKTGKVTRQYPKYTFGDLGRGGFASMRLFVVDGKLIIGVKNYVAAVNPLTGAELWQFTTDTSKHVFFVSGSPGTGKIFAAITNEIIDWELAPRWPSVMLGGDIVCLDLQNGKELWRNTDWNSKCLGQLIPQNNRLYVYGHGWPNKWVIQNQLRQTPTLGVIDPSNGVTKWLHEFKDPSVTPAVPTPYEYYFMMPRGDSIFCGESKKMAIFNALTGKYTVWKPGVDNMRCTRGTMTPNYICHGMGLWIDRSFNWTWKPVRRSGCGLPAHFGYGMSINSPTICGCIKEYADGKGFVAFVNQSGTPQVVPDAYRFAPGGTYIDSGYASGKSTNTHVLQKSLLAQDIENSPIVKEWPEYSTRTLFKKSSRFTLGDCEIINHGSLLQIEINYKGLNKKYVIGGRAQLDPIRYQNKIFIGSNDGFVYCFDIEKNCLLWKFMAAPYDMRAMVNAQLESNWPVVELSLQDSLLHIKAGRQPSLSGGYFLYDLNIKNTTILAKKRQFLPEQGSLSAPEKQYVIEEEIAINEHPDFEFNKKPSLNKLSVNSSPEIRVNSSGIKIIWGTNSTVRATITLLDSKGRLLLKHSGNFTRRGVLLPTKGIGKGFYTVRIQSGDLKLTKSVSLR